MLEKRICIEVEGSHLTRVEIAHVSRHQIGYHWRNTKNRTRQEITQITKSNSVMNSGFEREEFKLLSS